MCLSLAIFKTFFTLYFAFNNSVKYEEVLYSLIFLFLVFIMLLEFMAWCISSISENSQLFSLQICFCPFCPSYSHWDWHYRYVTTFLCAPAGSYTPSYIFHPFFSPYLSLDVFFWHIFLFPNSLSTVPHILINPPIPWLFLITLFFITKIFTWFFFIVSGSLLFFCILSFNSLNVLTVVTLKSVYDNSTIWIFCVYLIISPFWFSVDVSFIITYFLPTVGHYISSVLDIIWDGR